MELETQVQVSTNQLRRQDEEIKKQREGLETAELRDREAAARLLEEQRRYSDLESKMQDELMKAKISDAEKTQQIAELMQKIGQLELKVSTICSSEFNNAGYLLKLKFVSIHSTQKFCVNNIFQSYDVSSLLTFRMLCKPISY